MSTVSALTISAVVVVATMVMVVAMHGTSTPPIAEVPRAKETIIHEKAAPPVVCSYMEQSVVNPSSQPTGTHLTQAGYRDSSINASKLPPHLDLDSWKEGFTSQIRPVLECPALDMHLPSRPSVPRNVIGDEGNSLFTMTEKYHQARQGLCKTPAVDRKLTFADF